MPTDMLMTQTGYLYDSATYYRARYYDPAIGRFISEDPADFGGGVNFYKYAGNSPLDHADPTGLKDVYVVIWTSSVWFESVGHVAILDMNGNTILSQFPTPHSISGDNTLLSWTDTYNREGRDPDFAYLVHVPDDKAFDSAVLKELNSDRWFMLPLKSNQTNCVSAADNALRAGGVPAGWHSMPGDLNDRLYDLSEFHNKDGWSVKPVPLSNLPGAIKF